ncbi:hypothetical protein KLA_16552 [Cellulophaga geojensis KL-A]|uniref:Uncharacterized protein n=1 Tax=Cellulophaga geojensis KL-A TaxID=1328323 RepID=A0ABN0RJQ4_9FLAO|nr:hypothetical protein [Cellulophaga geojensis]EWH10562.1 hypothetical protein KLA_16552 [Cellulophaga geojensis KL-A]
MSLKKTITAPITNNEKQGKKVVNISDATHARISLIADLFNVTKNQAISNIVLAFFKENEDEIKDRITIRKDQLDKMF